MQQADAIRSSPAAQDEQESYMIAQTPTNDQAARNAALAVALVAMVLALGGLVGQPFSAPVQAQAAPTPALALPTQRPVIIIATPTAPPEHQERGAMVVEAAPTVPPPVPAPTPAPEIVYVDRTVVQLVEVPAAAYPCDQVCEAYKSLPTLALTNDAPTPVAIDPRQLEWSLRRTR
jgi:hypothetical protein